MKGPTVSSYLPWALLVILMIMPINTVHGEMLSLSVSVKLLKDEVPLPEAENTVINTINKLGYTVRSDADISLEGWVSVTDEKQISGIRPMTMVSLSMDIQIKNSKTGEVLDSFFAKGNGVGDDRREAYQKGLRNIKIDESKLSAALKGIAERLKEMAKTYFDEGKLLLEQGKYREALNKLKNVYPESDEFTEAQMFIQDIRVMIPKPTLAVLKFKPNESDIADSFNDVLTTTLVQKEAEEIIVLEWEQILGRLDQQSFDIDLLLEPTETSRFVGPIGANFVLLGNLTVSDIEIEVNARLVSVENSQIVTAFQTKSFKDQLEKVAEEIVAGIHKAIETGKLDRIQDIKIDTNLPRIMILISEEPIHRSISNPVVETAMMYEFWENGLRVVEPVYSSRIRQAGEGKAAIAGDIKSAISLGKQYGAGVIIVGKAFIDNENNAQVEARAIDSNTEMILTANEHANASNAVDSLRVAGRRLADHIIEPITAGWPIDFDGVTPKSTNLSLPLNGMSENNSLDYDAQDKVDWWKIEVPTSGELTVTVTSVPKFGLDIALYDPSGTNQIADSSSGTESKQVAAKLDLAAAYHVKIYVDKPGSITTYTIHTSYTDMRFLKGFRSYEEGEYTECISYLEEALREGYASELNLLNAHLYLGIAYVAKDWKSKAIAQFKEVLRIKPDYELPPDISPKIVEAFDEARRMVGR
jgi:tetratricopeptide (TPR) repeat protein